jgi:hypothetical protein
VNIPTVTNPSDLNFPSLVLPTPAAAPANANMLTSAQKKGSPKIFMDGSRSRRDDPFAGL